MTQRDDIPKQIRPKNPKRMKAREADLIRRFAPRVSSWPRLKSQVTGRTYDRTVLIWEMHEERSCQAGRSTYAILAKLKND